MSPDPSVVFQVPKKDFVLHGTEKPAGPAGFSVPYDQDFWENPGSVCLCYRGTVAGEQAAIYPYRSILPKKARWGRMGGPGGRKTLAR